MVVLVNYVKTSSVLFRKLADDTFDLQKPPMEKQSSYFYWYKKTDGVTFSKQTPLFKLKLYSIHKKELTFHMIFCPFVFGK